MNMDMAVGKKPTRNERRKAETRGKLLAAARIVIAEKGLEAATIKDISDAADVGVGSFYNHFDTKQEISEAVFEVVGHELANAADAFNKLIDDPVERVGAAMSGFFMTLATDPVLSQLVMTMAQLDSDTGRSLSARLLPDLELGIEQGVFFSPNVDVTRAFVVGSLLAFGRDRAAGALDASTNEHAVLLGLRILGVPEEEALRVARKYAEFFGGGTEA